MSELMRQGIVGLEREVAEKTAALEAAQAEAERLRAENARLREALSSISALKTIWGGAIKTNLNQAIDIARAALATNDTQPIDTPR